MSSVVQILTQSDTLIFDNLTYDLVGPSQIDPGPKSAAKFCVSKATNTLDFELSTKKHLQIQLPFEVLALFHGASKGQTPAGDAIIEWTLDQTIGKSVSVSGINIDINHIYGPLLTLCRPLLPREQGQSCSGANRSLGVAIETVPGNSLTVEATVLGLDVNVFAKNVTFNGRGGDQFSFAPIIHVLRDECGIGAKAGATQSFWVSVPNLGLQGAQYVWSVTGGSIIGSNDAYSVLVQVGSGIVTVSVTVTVAGVAQSVSISYVPETDETLRMKEIRCQVLRLVHWNIFFDPLWDPLKWTMDVHHSQSDFRAMKRTIDKLTTLLDSAIALTAKTGGQHG